MLGRVSSDSPLLLVLLGSEFHHPASEVFTTIRLKQDLSTVRNIIYIVVQVILQVKKEWLILKLVNRNQLQTALISSPSYASLNLKLSSFVHLIDLDE